MSETAIRQKIFEIIAGQANLVDPSYASASLGMVHKYERWTAEWGVFLNLFKDPATGRIFGWEIRRASFHAVKLDSLQEEITHGYVIKGYLGVQDSEQTERLFNQKIDELSALFRGNHTLDGLCLDAGPISAETIEERTFGTVFCHYAELRLPVVEIQ